MKLCYNNLTMPEEQFGTRELSQQELKWSYWFVIHRDLLKKIFIGFLIAINALLWGYSVYTLLRVWVIDGNSYNLHLSILPDNLVNFVGLRSENEPRDIVISKINIISSGQGRYDLAALVSNSNKDFAAESFDYQFIISGAETKTYRGFILPNEEKYLADLSVDSKTRPARADLKISNIQWRRITPHEVSDIENFKSSRLNFEIKNIEYNPSSTSGLGEKLPVSTVSFDVYNNTAYNYWEVGFYILLHRGASIGGINYIAATELKAGETRYLEARWFEPLPASTQVEVRPVLNILDSSVYMKFEGRTGEFSGQ